MHILLNQRKGRKKNASKYEVLLANALLVQHVQIVSKGGGAKLILIKCMSNFGQRAGCRLQMTTINCEHTGKNAEEGLRAKKLPPFSPRRL